MILWGQEAIRDKDESQTLRRPYSPELSSSPRFESLSDSSVDIDNQLSLPTLNPRLTHQITRHALFWLLWTSADFQRRSSSLEKQKVRCIFGHLFYTLSGSWQVQATFPGLFGNFNEILELSEEFPKSTTRLGLLTLSSRVGIFKRWESNRNNLVGALENAHCPNQLQDKTNGRHDTTIEVARRYLTSFMRRQAHAGSKDELGVRSVDELQTQAHSAFVQILRVQNFKTLYFRLTVRCVSLNLPYTEVVIVSERRDRTFPSEISLYSSPRRHMYAGAGASQSSQS